jgi:large subunit ribosomal protein L1
LQKGKIYFKSNKNGVINTSIGRMSFEPKNIHDNFIAIFGSILKIKPSTTKGYYIKSASLSTTMGPSIKINFANLK